MEPVKQTLMIVEDDEVVAYFMRDVLEAKGYICLLESNGERVLERVIDEKPVLILLDIKLVGIDGYTICRRLKSEPSTQSIPVIFISALHTERDVLEAKEAGGIYFVSKPFDIEFLVGKVKDVILRYSSDEVRRSISRKVLYVESGYLADGFHWNDSFISLLTETEFEISLVRDPREALRKTREIQPDVVLLDLDDSLLSVRTVTDALWRNKYTRTIPVVILSSFAEKQRLLCGDMHSIVEVLQKPVLKQSLLQTLRMMFQKTTKTIATKQP